jgi:predicted lipid-binding transport protein (Tim44 family)
LLGNIQSAFSTEDLSALSRMVLAEMLSYFSEQLADNASRGANLGVKAAPSIRLWR